MFYVNVLLTNIVQKKNSCTLFKCNLNYVVVPVFSLGETNAIKFITESFSRFIQKRSASKVNIEAISWFRIIFETITKICKPNWISLWFKSFKGS